MDFSYVAGFTDADGSFEFSIRRRHRATKSAIPRNYRALGRSKIINGEYMWWEPVFAIKIQQKTQSGHEAMVQMSDFFKAQGIKCGLYFRKTKYKGRPYISSAIHIIGRKAITKLVENIVNKLTVKRKQAELYLQFFKEIDALPRKGYGGRMFTTEVCISFLERWEPVRLRKQKRRWEVEDLKSFSRLS